MGGPGHARRLGLACLAALGLGLLGAVIGARTYAAFSATTQGSGNVVAAGRLEIADNDAAADVVTLTSATPGSSSTGCIRVTSSGTLDADVRMYGSVSGTLAPDLTLTITRGAIPAPTFPSCTGFAPDATNYAGAGSGVVYSGPLSGYPASWAAGVVDAPGAAEAWSPGETHDYRIAVTLGSNLAAEGRTASATFTWEARNR